MRLSVTIILTILFTLIPAALFLYVIVLAIRALRTYIRTNGVRQEKKPNQAHPRRSSEGAPPPLPDDPGVRGRVRGRQPSGRL